MVSYRLDGGQGTRSLSGQRPLPHDARTIADYITETRESSNEFQHPIAVFDVDGQPVFRNSALAVRLTSEQQSSTADRTWQVIYATACRVVAESIMGRSGIATVIPLNQRSFVILGSLLRQTSGTVYGAVIHIAEVTGSMSGSIAPSASEDQSGRRSQDSGDEKYRVWMQRRDESRSRMQRLSPREAEVVSRVAAGLPNKSIARELEISVKTIEKHRANAVRKLGITSTPEMVRIAVLADLDMKAASAETAAASPVPAPNMAAPKPRFSAGSELV